MHDGSWPAVACTAMSRSHLERGLCASALAQWWDGSAHALRLKGGQPVPTEGAEARFPPTVLPTRLLAPAALRPSRSTAPSPKSQCSSASSRYNDGSCGWVETSSAGAGAMATCPRCVQFCAAIDEPRLLSSRATVEFALRVP